MQEQSSADLSAVRTVLLSKKTGDTIALAAGDFPAAQWPLINHTLVALFGTNTTTTLQLPAGGNIPEPSGDTLAFQATLAFPLLKATNQSAEVIFQTAGDNVNLRFSLSGFAAGWTPGQAFPDLKNTLLDEFTYTNVTLTIDTNLLPAVTNPGFGLVATKTAGDNSIQIRYGLSCNVGFAAAAGFTWLLGKSTMPIIGTIDITDEQPVVQLSAADASGPVHFSSPNLPLFGTSPQFAFQLLAGYSLQNNTTYVYTVLGVTDAVAAGLPPMIKSYNLPFSSLNPAVLTLQGTFDYTDYGSGFSDPASSHYLSTILSGVKSVFPVDKLLPTNFGTVFNMTGKAIQNNYYTLGIPGTYSPLGDWLVFHNVQLGLLTGFPGNQQFVYASTKADLFGKTFDASISFPDLNISIAMEDGEFIDIAALLKQLSITIPGLNNTKCTVFILTGDITNKAYSATVGLSDVWSVSFGNTSMALDSVLFTLGTDSGNPWGSIAAGASVAGLSMDVQADYDQTQGWRLLLSIQPGQTPDLHTTQNQIAQNFNVPAGGVLDSSQFDFKSLNLAFATGSATQQVTFDFAGAFHFTSLDIDFSVHFNLTESNG